MTEAGAGSIDRELASQPALWRRAAAVASDVSGLLPGPGERVAVAGPVGVVYQPLTGRWTKSADCDVNYMMTVTRDAA